MLVSSRARIGMRELSQKYASKTVGVDRTKQHFRDECDINVLVKRFAKTGIINQRQAIPLRGDFTDVMDYGAMQEAIRAANQSFLSLPSSVRERFGHSPEAFIKFTLNKDNLPELRKLGLAKPEEIIKPPEPMLVRVVPEPDKK